MIFKNNDVTALPLFDVREIGGQTDRIVLKPNLQAYRESLHCNLPDVL